MKKQLQKVFAMVLAISMLMSMMSFTASAEGEPPASQKQVVSVGGESSDAHVKVSKTIEGTDYENVFDITLTVETETELEAVDAVTEHASLTDRQCVVIDAGHGGIDGGATSCSGGLLLLEQTLNVPL